MTDLREPQMFTLSFQVDPLIKESLSPERMRDYITMMVENAARSIRQDLEKFFFNEATA